MCVRPRLTHVPARPISAKPKVATCSQACRRVTVQWATCRSRKGTHGELCYWLCAAGCAQLAAGCSLQWSGMMLPLWMVALRGASLLHKSSPTHISIYIYISFTNPTPSRPRLPQRPDHQRSYRSHRPPCGPGGGHTPDQGGDECWPDAPWYFWGCRIFRHGRVGEQQEQVGCTR